MEVWSPGSFTKNFSWGAVSSGLKELHNAIRIGFENQLSPVPRDLFRRRIEGVGRPYFIPANFFLLNEVRDGKDFIVVDELVFQALTNRHSSQFDKLALFAFNLSYVGKWSGARAGQVEPALWSKRYIQDRVSRTFDWNVDGVNADDIEKFISSDARYTGATTRKLSTNLNYLYSIGRLREFGATKIERWWLSALFLTLDRFLRIPVVAGAQLDQQAIYEALRTAEFWSICGRRTTEKEVAVGYFVALYAACAGILRFSPDAMSERESALIPNHMSNAPPTLDPVGILHPSNPHARNIIPHAARVLAKYLAGFELFEAADLDGFDVRGFVKDRTRKALADLQSNGVKPLIGSDDLIQLMRGE